MYPYISVIKIVFIRGGGGAKVRVRCAEYLEEMIRIVLLNRRRNRRAMAGAKSGSGERASQMYSPRSLSATADR